MYRRSLLTVVCLLFLVTQAFAEKPVARVFLVGVEGYEKAARLDCVGNDIRRLAEALSDRCGFEVTMVLDTAVDDDVTAIGPTTHRDALMAKIRQWIAGVGPSDVVILVFSGHGFLGPDGKSYLAMINCDPADPASGGISAAWLREQLRRCPAASKLLVLDACHSGSSKGIAARSLSGKAMAVEFAGAGGVTTLASCQEDEESHLWFAKKQSLFCYWLTEAIKGHADADSDGRVSFAELSEFVIDNVTLVAENVLSKRQTPLVVEGSSAGEPLAFKAKPIPLVRLVDDMAEQIDTQLRCEKFPAVGVVPQFACGEADAALTLDFGILPGYVAEQLRRQLARKGRGAYRVVSENAMREALRAKAAGPADVGASKTVALVAKGLSDDLPVPAIVAGKVRHRRGAMIRLSCSLVDAAHQSDVASAGGSAYLNDSERSMIPDSVVIAHTPADVRTDDVLAAASSDAIPPPQAQDAPVNAPQFDQLAEGRHPLEDESFPYRVNVWVRDAEGGYTISPNRWFEGNKCFVNLRRRDVYAIRVENRSVQPVFMRLLVDGLNTLPQRIGVMEKGVVLEPAGDEEPLTMAPRVSLRDARPWHLAPRSRNIIRGFFETTDRDRRGERASAANSPRGDGDGVGRTFKVVDAADAIAARRGYPENVGLITAAFYAEAYPEDDSSSDRQLPPSGTRGLDDSGTGIGEAFQEKVDRYTGDAKPGKFIGVVHLRYGKASESPREVGSP